VTRFHSIAYQWRETDAAEIFVCSFSRQGNLLSQWRAYAPRDGVSIGFPVELIQLMEKHIPGIRLHEIVYDQMKHAETADKYVEIISQLVKQSGEELFFRHSIFNILFGIQESATTMKHPGFSEEEEIRLTYTGNSLREHNRQGSAGNIKYVNINFGEIFYRNSKIDFMFEYLFISPGIDKKPRMQNADKIMSMHKIRYRSIVYSGIPLR
jgi:hypothetical protein